MRESIFTTEVIRSLRKISAFAYKIPDAPTSKITGLRFTATKPCDIVACVDGTFVAIECKQIKKWKAFGMNDMRPSQIVNLPNVIRAEGNAFVFLNVRIAKERLNKLIILDWSHWGKELEKGSIKAKDLKNMLGVHGKEVEGKIIFDLSNWRDVLNF